MNNDDYLISKAGCIPYNPKLKQRSRELRNNMTFAEKKLWNDFLRKHAFTFHRQKVIDNYILDFYCSKAMLAIEIDGDTHYSDESIKYDTFRTEILNNYGIKVIRFTNNEIYKSFEGVCKEINKNVDERVRQLSGNEIVEIGE